MATCRSVISGFVLAIVATACASWIVAVDALAADNPLSISAELGYSGVIKPQRWAPVSITVTNSGPDVDGSLEISSPPVSGPGGPGSPATYTMPLSIPAGASRRIRTYIDAESAAPATIRIIRDGRVLATQETAYPRTAATLVGVLSDDSTALDDFAAVHAGAASPEVVHLRPAEVPDSVLALRAFDLLAIDDFPTDSLSPLQLSALGDYVRTGGALLVGTGATSLRTLAGLPSDLVPMKIDGLVTLPPSPALDGLAGIHVATGTLTGGAAWLSEAGQPLIVERNEGAGVVTVAAFDWNQPAVRSGPATKDLLRQVLVRATFGAESPQVATPSQATPFGAQGGSLYQRSGAVVRELGNLPALDLPSVALTGGLVAVYVLLVGPVNFFALRALRRRALAWFTLPVVALLAAGAAYGGGVMIKGRSVQTNQVSILHLEPGTDRGYLETYSGVLAPTRGDYQVKLDHRGQFVSPITSYNGFNGFGGGGIRVNAGDGTIELPGMTAFTLRGFGTERIADAPRLSPHLVAANGRLTGSLENLSSTPFTDAVLLAGDGFQKLGPLAPGAKVAIDFAPATTTINGPPAILRIYPNYSLGPRPSAPDAELRAGEAKTEILSLLYGGNFKGAGSVAITPMLVAFTDQSFQSFTVNGGHPLAHVQSAVAMPLQVDEIGPGPLSPGFVAGRVVDFVGATAPGPPGALVVQTGSVTLQFTPRLAAERHLTGAAVVASNPYFVKGSGTPNGTVSADAWDWSRSAWVQIPYQNNGITDLPSGAVDPGSGEVRLRVTAAASFFMATGISLQGTVS